MGCQLGNSILPPTNGERDDDRHPSGLLCRGFSRRGGRQIGLLHLLRGKCIPAGSRKGDNPMLSKKGLRVRILVQRFCRGLQLMMCSNSRMRKTSSCVFGTDCCGRVDLAGNRCTRNHGTCKGHRQRRE